MVPSPTMVGHRAPEADLEVMAAGNTRPASRMAGASGAVGSCPGACPSYTGGPATQLSVAGGTMVQFSLVSWGLVPSNTLSGGPATQLSVSGVRPYLCPGASQPHIATSQGDQLLSLQNGPIARPEIELAILTGLD